MHIIALTKLVVDLWATTVALFFEAEIDLINGPTTADGAVCFD